MNILFSDLKARTAIPADFEFVLKLLKSAASRLQKKHIDQWQYWHEPPQHKIKWLKEGLECGEYQFLIHQDQIAAMYRVMEEDLEYWGKQDAAANYLHSLVVHDDFIGNQLGTSIIEQLKITSRKQGKTFLRLDCHSGNKNLCNYYDNHGFKQVGAVQMSHSKNALYEFKL